MYVSKRYNNKVSENGYVSFGDKYVKKSPSPSRAVGKQFGTLATETFQTDKDVYHFGKPNPYTDKIDYRKQQPLDRKKGLGFGSSDATKKAEFSFHPRAQQWKARVRGEEAYLAKTLSRPVTIGDDDDVVTRAAEREYNRKRWFQANVPENLFDIGRGDHTTPLCMKCKSETFFCKHRHQKDINDFREQRRVGEVSPASSGYGAFHFPSSPTSSKSLKSSKSAPALPGLSRPASRPAPLDIPKAANLTPLTTTNLEIMKRKVATLPMTSLTPMGTALTPSGRRISTVNPAQYFSPSNYGRKHHMASFQDQLHIDKAQS